MSNIEHSFHKCAKATRAGRPHREVVAILEVVHESPLGATQLIVWHLASCPVAVRSQQHSKTMTRKKP